MKKYVPDCITIPHDIKLPPYIKFEVLGVGEKGVAQIIGKKNFKNLKNINEGIPLDSIDIFSEKKESVPLINKTSAHEEVNYWLQNFENGKFDKLAQYFEGKDGSNIFNLKSKQLLEYLRDDCGIKDTFLIRELCSILNLND